MGMAAHMEVNWKMTYLNIVINCSDDCSVGYEEFCRPEPRMPPEDAQREYYPFLSEPYIRVPTPTD